MSQKLWFRTLTILILLVSAVLTHAKPAQAPTTPVQAARLNQEDINEIAYSPNGTLLAVASDTSIRLYDTATYQEVALLMEKPSTSVAFSPDGRTIASANDKEVRLWNVESRSLKRMLTLHSTRVGSVAFSPDGRTIASGGRDGIRLWDANTGMPKHTLESERVFSLVFSPDGRILASGHRYATVRLWDLRRHTNKGTLWGTGEDGGSVWCIAFSPDGSTLASGSRQGPRSQSINGRPSIWDDIFIDKPYNAVVHLWDVDTEGLKHKLRGHRNWVNCIVFSPDGHTIASGSRDNTIRLWNANTGVPKHKFTGHTDTVKSVVFSPDGRTLTSVSREGTVLLWKRD